jgi:hypothetical protein
MIDTEQIKPHMPVVCSENGQFAVVDHLDGKGLKLTRDDKASITTSRSIGWRAWTTRSTSIAPAMRP